ncbi:MAG: type II secretion system F family protein [Planctomycetota bacterium]|jgi:type IV pilus assembly protein PilC
MPMFKYEALDSQGVSVKDEIEALSQQEAISKIRNMGYFPTKVSAISIKKKAPTKAAAAKPKRKGAGGKVKSKVLTQFTRQLSTLQDAGLPILRSLRILEEQQKAGRFKRIIGYLADDIEGGATLSEAMSRYPKCFDRLLYSMVAAGETGGVLDLILARVSEFMEQSQKLRSKVKGAMVYPIVVLSAAFLILIGLMKWVIPKFKEVLTEMVQGGLNKITVIVLAVSEWIAFHYGWLVLISIPFFLIVFVKFLRRFRAGRLILDHIKLKLPVIGSLSSKISITRWTRTLGTLISAGVPILDALNVTRETAGNEVYSNMLAKVHDSIRQGESFAVPLRQSKTVDLIVSNMVAVGEETGDLDKMLLKVADNYDDQVDTMVSSLMSLLEPLIIIVLGGMVLLIVLSVFLPMVQIITGLSTGGM